MANFSIIEGDDPIEPIKDEFIRMYESGVKVKTICQELNISNSQYQNFRMRLNRRGELKVNRNPNGGQKRVRQYDKFHPKNYHFNRNTKCFHVVRKNRFYAKFRNEDEAREFVRLMRECDWDYSKRLELKERVLNE